MVKSIRNAAALAASLLIGNVSAYPTILYPSVQALPSCVETTIPPGVKPYGCMDVVCQPTAVAIGEEFTITVKWCLQRSRKWSLTFGILTMDTHSWLDGTGYAAANATTGHILENDNQCGIHTFPFTMKQEKFGDDANIKAIGDYMWKFFITPVWGPDDNTITDPFPNMISECGIGTQPIYGAPGVNTLCPVVEDVVWTPFPTKAQDAIDYKILPDCITPGQPWNVTVHTHLESNSTADLHFNLQIGTGGDKYLAADDIYVGETDIWGYMANSYWNATTNTSVPIIDYWTVNTVTFPAEVTALFQPTEPKPYLATFFTPQGQQFGQDPTGAGWTILDREFLIDGVMMCGAPK